MPTGESETRHLITELSRINSELVTRQREVAREAAQVASQRERLTQHLGMTAHDLKNPLQVVLGLAEILQADPELSERHRDVVARISRSAQSMRAIVDNLTEGVIAPSAGLQDLAPVDLRDLADSVVGRYQVLTARRDLRVVLDVPHPEESLVVQGEVVRLERVLDNLVGNAVKFSSDGSTVTVRLERDGAEAVIRVIDQGPGIDPARHDAVFELFHREEGTAHVPGVGLGLAIVRQLVDLHGGSVHVESAVGHGATFVVRLPRDGAA